MINAWGMEKLIGLKKQPERSIDLNEDEVICSECEGRGYTPKVQKFDTMASTCAKCKGKGKVDWVTNAMVTPEEIPMTGNYYISNLEIETIFNNIQNSESPIISSG